MKILINSIMAVAFILFATTVSAYTISGDIVVGDLDDLVYSGSLGDSGDATELEFVNAYLATLGDGWLAEEYFKDQDMGEDFEGTNPWMITNDPDIYAYDFGLVETSYFLIKTGNIGGLEIADTDPVLYYPAIDTFLYRNVSSLQYAVISLNELEDYGTKDVGIYKVSHIGFSTPVPEPSTLLLLGAGIAGLAVYRRKKH